MRGVPRRTRRPGSGRFDALIEIPPPDESARLAIFRVHIAEKPAGEDVDLESLAQETEGLVGADIASICQKATMLAIRELVEACRNREIIPEELSVRMPHFQEAMAMVQRTSPTSSSR